MTLQEFVKFLPNCQFSGDDSEFQTALVFSNKAFKEHKEICWINFHNDNKRWVFMFLDSNKTIDIKNPKNEKLLSLAQRLRNM